MSDNTPDHDPHDEDHGDDWFADLDDLSDLYADEGTADEPESGDTSADSDSGYVDEDGNPIPESELHLYMDVDDDEVESQPAAPATPPTPAGTAVAPQGTGGPRVPKVLIAGVLAGVVLLGGGTAWFLSSLGEQNTAETATAAVQQKTEKVKAKVAEQDPVNACDPKQLESGTLWDEVSGDAPKMQLRVLETAPLPPAAKQRVEDGGRTLEMEILQVNRFNWGLYLVEPPAAPAGKGDEPPMHWWKIDLDTSGDTMRLREEDWPGGDTAAMGACPMIERGGYQVVGDDVPAEALGVRDGVVEVAMMMADASADNIVYGLVGNSVARMQLEYAPADGEIDGEETAEAG